MAWSQLKLLSPDGSVRQLEQLYDLRSDPGQRSDVFPPGGRALDGLHGALAGFLKIVEIEGRPESERSAVEITDPELLKQLEELGYIK